MEGGWEGAAGRWEPQPRRPRIGPFPLAWMEPVGSPAGVDGVGDVTHGSVGIEAEARTALAALATQLVRPEGMLSTLDRDRMADPSVEERLGLLTDRLRDATGELLSVLELTRSHMIGVELLQAHANQARVLLQLYDEHQQMVEELLRSQGATDGAPGPTDGLGEEELAEVLQLASQIARLPSSKLLGSASSCECVICQSELRDVAGSLLPAGTGGAKEPCMLQCGHRFHRHCIGSWLERSRKCPLCRAEQTPAKMSEMVTKPPKLREAVAAATRRSTVSLTPPTPSVRCSPGSAVSVSAWQTDDGSAGSRFAGTSDARTTGAPALHNRPSTTHSVGRMTLRHSVSRGAARAVSRGSSRGVSRTNGMRTGGDHLGLPPRPATSEASDAARLMRWRAEYYGFGRGSLRDRTGGRGSLTRSASSPLTALLAPLQIPATGLAPGVGSESEPMMLRGHGDSHARARQHAREQARASAQLPKHRKGYRRPEHAALPIRSLGSQSRRLATELPVRRQLSFRLR